MARTASPHFSASLNKDGCSRAVHSLLRDRAQQAVLSNAPGQGTAGPSIPMLRDRAQQSRPSLAPGQDAAGRPSLCSGTGLRSQKKFLRSPVPTPMDGPNPQRQLHLRAAKGKNALVFRVHNTKTSIKAAFCAAKGIVSPNHRAQSTNNGPTSHNLRCERDNPAELSRSQ